MNDKSLFERQLGGAMQMIVIAYRAGYSLGIVFEQLADLLPEPVSGVFKTLVTAEKQGSDYGVHLKDLQQDIASNRFDEFVEKIRYYQAMGGNLADMLEPIGNSMVSELGIDPEVEKQRSILNVSVREREKFL